MTTKTPTDGTGMKTKLGVVAGLLLTLAFANSAHAKADTLNDQAFIITLNQYSIPYTSVGLAEDEGLQACMKLDQTGNLVDAGMDVAETFPAWNLRQVGEFVGAAVGAYCPRHNNLYKSV